MGRTIKLEIKGNDLQLMEALLADGHIEHKFAVRLQTVINRAKGLSTNSIALFLGININTVSNHVQRYNNGGLEALLCDKTRKPGTEPIQELGKIHRKLSQHFSGKYRLSDETWMAPCHPEVPEWDHAKFFGKENKLVRKG